MVNTNIYFESTFAAWSEASMFTPPIFRFIRSRNKYLNAQKEIEHQCLSITAREKLYSYAVYIIQFV